MKLTEEQVKTMRLLKKNYCTILEIYKEGYITGRKTIIGIKIKSKYRALEEDLNDLMDTVCLLSLEDMYIFYDNIIELEENEFFFLIGMYFEKIYIKVKKLNSVKLLDELNCYKKCVMHILDM